MDKSLPKEHLRLLKQLKRKAEAKAEAKAEEAKRQALASASKVAETELVIDKPVKPKRLAPAPVTMMPSTDMAIVNNLVCREISSPSEGEIEPQSPTIKLLKDTVTAMAKGSDMSGYQQALQQLASNQPEKAELILTQLNQIDMEHMPAYVEMADASVRILQKSCKRNDVTVAEALATWQISKHEIAEIRATLQAARASGVNGITSIVDKVNASLKSVDSGKNIAQFTTPQGRELIRKSLWALKQEVMAKQDTASKEGSK
jgi:uncharacterized protein YlaN (UPF0358 family)